MVTVLLTIKEVAGKIRMSEWWVRNEIKLGNLKARRFGRYFRVDSRVLEAYIADREER